VQELDGLIQLGLRSPTFIASTAAAMGEAFGVSSAGGLTGRDAELAVASAAVRELCDGRASALVIEGEVGVGKTRLVQAILDDARTRHVAVCCGRAHPFERTRPFGVVAAALELNQRSADQRRAEIGALLASRGAGARTRAAGDYQVVDEIVDLVETMCADRPVLLVCEDVHWADSASLWAILSLARQLPLAALLVVVTIRPPPLSAEVVRLLDDLAERGARVPATPAAEARRRGLACPARGRSVTGSRPHRHAGQGRREPVVGGGHPAFAGRRRTAAAGRG
jgi:hypothetical protein